MDANNEQIKYETNFRKNSLLKTAKYFIGCWKLFYLR